MTPSDATSAPDPDGAARPRGAKHSVTARTKARRRAVEILFEADQRGLLRPDHGQAADYGERGDSLPLKENTISSSSITFKTSVKYRELSVICPSADISAAASEVFSPNSEAIE